jgi:hypothetical protein
MSLFCERCKTYHEPGGPGLCAPPYPSVNEKLIRECTSAIIDALRVQTQYLVGTRAANIRIDFEKAEKQLMEGEKE